MVQFCCGLCFANQGVQELRIATKLGTHDFDRYFAFQLRILCKENGTHTALTQFTEEKIVTEFTWDHRLFVAVGTGDLLEDVILAHIHHFATVFAGAAAESVGTYQRDFFVQIFCGCFGHSNFVEIGASARRVPEAEGWIVATVET